MFQPVEPLLLGSEDDAPVLDERRGRVVADVTECDADARVLGGVTPDMRERVRVEPRKSA